MVKLVQSRPKEPLFRRIYSGSLACAGQVRSTLSIRLASISATGWKQRSNSGATGPCGTGFPEYPLPQTSVARFKSIDFLPAPY